MAKPEAAFFFGANSSSSDPFRYRQFLRCVLRVTGDLSVQKVGVGAPVGLLVVCSVFGWNRYVECIEKCHRHYQQHFAKGVGTIATPLVVNTQGWITGMTHSMLSLLYDALLAVHLTLFKFLLSVAGLGLSLLCKVVRAVQPKHVVEIQKLVAPADPTTQPKAIVSDVGYEFTRYQLSPFTPQKTSKGQSTPTAASIRNLSLGVYFLAGSGEASSQSLAFRAIPRLLAAQRPFKIDASHLIFHIMHGQVNPEEYLYALNGALVGLCSATASTAVLSQMCEDNSALKVLQQMPDCKWVGLGIIRGIEIEASPVNGRKVVSLFVITPVLADELRSVNVVSAMFFSCS